MACKKKNLESRDFLGQRVIVDAVDDTVYNGILYTIDPETNDVFIVKQNEGNVPDEIACSFQIILGPSVSNISRMNDFISIYFNQF